MGGIDVLAIPQFPGVSEAMKTCAALSKGPGISFSTLPAVQVEELDKLVAGNRKVPSVTMRTPWNTACSRQY